MKRTHNEAIEAFAAGNRQQAWEIAQQDEGLSPHVSQKDWMLFAARCVANRAELAETQAAYANGIGS